MRPGPLLALCVLLAASSTAQPPGREGGVDPELFAALHWRLLGPFRGGRVLAVAGVPGEPRHFYFGSVNGGVWETLDAGRTWNPIFDGQPIGIDRRASRWRPSRSAGALRRQRREPTCAPTSPRATASTSRPTAAGPGRTSACADSQQIARILVHPTRPRPRLRRRARPPLRPQRRARRLPLARRRRALARRCSGTDDDTGADRPRLRARQPARALCRALADAPHALEHLPAFERPGQRALQVDRRRRPLESSSPATACPPSRGGSASPWLPASRSASTPIVDAD